MLKIPTPKETSVLKVKITSSTKKELDTFVSYVKSEHPHANLDTVMEAMIQKVIPRAGVEAKKYKAFKNSAK
ncbi:MAG: hypothetical protein JKY15_06565 [Deltaproteobacteria bacterium]|nr:hypothetical protein [Deltaproteobacteria bacterium]